MLSYLMEWSFILFRCLHVIAAMAWIGASFYFVWLDNNLIEPESSELKDKGVAGELWAVHGGGFYNPQKYLVAPRQLPAHLHWFYWESYTTWLSGFALFVVLYLCQARTYLIDANVFAMSPGLAAGLALGFLLVSWLIYDQICRRGQAHPRLVSLLTSLYVAGSSFLVAQIFSGRAVFLLIGAMMASLMTANVLMVIIPGQRRMVAAMRAGQKPDPQDGIRAKQRSVHNTYLTLPVVFSMLSNHFSLLHSHPYHWFILIVMMAAGVAIRRFFVLRHKKQAKLWLPALASILILALLIFLAPAKLQSSSQMGHTGPSVQPRSLARVDAVIELRCRPCHSSSPSLLDAPPKGLVLDTPEQMNLAAGRIYEQAVRQKSMPIGNITQMTEDERALLATWFENLSKEP